MMKGSRNEIGKDKQLRRRFSYYGSISIIVLKCFWKRFVMPESRSFRNQMAGCLCFVLLVSTVFFHATVSRMGTEEFFQDEVSVKLDTTHSVIEEGSEERPYILVSFTNRGDTSLENLSAHTEEKGFRLEFPWKEDEDGDKKSEEDQVEKEEDMLASEGTVTAKVVLVNENRPGVYKGCIRFEADRAQGEAISILVPFRLKIKERIIIEVTEEPSPSFTPEITDVPQVMTTDVVPTPTVLQTDLPEGLPVSSQDPVDNPQDEVKRPAETPSVTKQPDQPGVGDGTAKWNIEETEVSGGYSENGIYFGSDHLRIKFGLTESHRNLKGFFYYSFAGHTGKVPAEDGEAVIEIEGDFAGELTVYFQDSQGNTSELWKKCCVLESAAPEIEIKKVADVSGEERIRVVITEPSEVISGIRQISVYVDGEDYGEYRENVTEEKLQNAWKAKKRSVFYLSLAGEEEHEYLIQASDVSGNMAEGKMKVAKSVSSDVISVVVPTEFSLHMNPYAKDQQIYSDLIPIINRSDFDIDMQISSVEVQVNSDNAGSQEKNCKVNLEIHQDGVMLDTVSGLESGNYQSKSFTLEKNNPNESDIFSHQIDFLRNGISRQILPTVSYSGKNVACIQLTGKLSEGSESLWRDGDLNVTVIFDFEKH